MAHYKLFFDGSCGPKNPGGTAAYGFVLMKSDDLVESGSGVIGSGPGMTNNLAEFYAIGKGLGAFIRRHDTTERHQLNVYGDSNLVIQIMNRHWKARPERPYYPHYEDAVGDLGIIRKNGHRVSFDWVPRELNKVCDDLSKAHQKKV